MEHLTKRRAGYGGSRLDLLFAQDELEAWRVEPLYRMASKQAMSFDVARILDDLCDECSYICAPNRVIIDARAMIIASYECSCGNVWRTDYWLRFVK